ncbi:MAG: arylsulfatase [Candidatus Latescibacterota bacterium]
MPPRLNIVFILTDQMRADCLGEAGHPVVQTPNLDMLARRGTFFTAAYSSVPSCIAARASLFTGLTPATHGRLGYEDRVPWEYGSTLAGELGRAGYQTHCVGKTHFYPQRAHLGFQSLESYEGDQNFDGRYVNDYHEWLREQTGGRLRETDHGVDWNSWYSRPSHLPEELHNNTWVVSRGIEFLRRRDPTRPFFLNLSFHRPHPPIDPPQAFFDLYRERPLPPVPVGDWARRYDVPVQDVNAWCGRVAPEQLDRTRRAYFAQVEHIDNQIGRFLMALGKCGAGPAWIVFTSDHGEMLGDHHLWRKTYAYEGSARVPLIVCPPAGASVHRSGGVVVQEDLMPTLLQIAGAPVPSEVEGRSVLPLLESTPETVGWRQYGHGEHSPCYAPETGMQYLTDGRWKYVWYTLGGEEHLFDLEQDPQELHDRAGDPAAAERLAFWRQRLVAELAPREEDGLCDGRRLLPGRRLPATRPQRTA